MPPKKISLSRDASPSGARPEVLAPPPLIEAAGFVPPPSVLFSSSPAVKPHAGQAKDPMVAPSRQLADGIPLPVEPSGPSPSTPHHPRGSDNVPAYLQTVPTVPSAKDIFSTAGSSSLAAHAGEHAFSGRDGSPPRGSHLPSRAPLSGDDTSDRLPQPHGSVSTAQIPLVRSHSAGSLPQRPVAAPSADHAAKHASSRPPARGVTTTVFQGTAQNQFLDPFSTSSAHAESEYLLHSSPTEVLGTKKTFNVPPYAPLGEGTSARLDHFRSHPQGQVPHQNDLSRHLSTTLDHGGHDFGGLDSRSSSHGPVNQASLFSRPSLNPQTDPMHMAPPARHPEIDARVPTAYGDTQRDNINSRQPNFVSADHSRVDSNAVNSRDRLELLARHLREQNIALANEVVDLRKQQLTQQQHLARLLSSGVPPQQHSVREKLASPFQAPDPASRSLRSDTRSSHSVDFVDQVQSRDTDVRPRPYNASVRDRDIDGSDSYRRSSPSAPAYADVESMEEFFDLSDLLASAGTPLDLPSVFDEDIFSEHVWKALLKENKLKLLHEDWRSEDFFSLVSQRIISSAQGQSVGYLGKTALQDLLAALRVGSVLTARGVSSSIPLSEFSSSMGHVMARMTKILMIEFYSRLTNPSARRVSAQDFAFFRKELGTSLFDDLFGEQDVEQLRYLVESYDAVRSSNKERGSFKKDDKSSKNYKNGRRSDNHRDRGSSQSLSKPSQRRDHHNDRDSDADRDRSRTPSTEKGKRHQNDKSGGRHNNNKGKGKDKSSGDTARKVSDAGVKP